MWRDRRGGDRKIYLLLGRRSQGLRERSQGSQKGNEVDSEEHLPKGTGINTENNEAALKIE